MMHIESLENQNAAGRQYLRHLHKQAAVEITKTADHSPESFGQNGFIQIKLTELDCHAFALCKALTQSQTSGTAVERYNLPTVPCITLNLFLYILSKE